VNFISKLLQAARFAAGQFRTTGNVPAAGDYEGDGKFDISVSRLSMVQWFRSNSLDGSIYGVQFGIIGDMIVPIDYILCTPTDPEVSHWKISKNEISTWPTGGLN
jgi:hypothetical protein